MRAIFLALLSANLLFLAWAKWIDGPHTGVAQDSLARLPRLQLVTEQPPARKPTSLSLSLTSHQHTLSLQLNSTCKSL